MAKESGQDGSVTFNSQDIPALRWTLDRSEPAIDTTDSGHSGARTRIAKGIYDWSATVECHFDTGATYPDVGDSASLVLTRSAGNTYTGTAIVTSAPLTTDIEGEAVNSITFEFAGNGALS